MSLWRCALLLLTLLAACDDDGVGGTDSGVDVSDASPGCGPLDGGIQVCNPECPGSWPDACNPPEACIDDLAAGRCMLCDEETGDWVTAYVESFCDTDAGI